MTQSPSLLSDVRFGSYLAYSSHGTSLLSRRSKDLCLNIKRDRASIIADVARRLAAEIERTPLGTVLGPDVSLVPAPRSGRLLKGALWPADRIAHELQGVGLGLAPFPLVVREHAVPKSATAEPGERPSARVHLESLLIRSTVPLTGRVTIIDDVITKGATTLAVASLIKHVHPNVDIAVFALVRTMSYGEIEAIRAPVVGTITLNRWGGTAREP